MELNPVLLRRETNETNPEEDPGLIDDEEEERAAGSELQSSETAAIEALKKVGDTDGELFDELRFKRSKMEGVGVCLLSFSNSQILGGTTAASESLSRWVYLSERSAF